MKLKTWKWFNKVIGGILFALWVSLLVQPWFVSLNKYLNYARAEIYQITWIFFVIVSGIIFIKIILYTSKKYYKIMVLILLIGLNILILYLLNWPLLLFIPVSLILILISFRFQFYEEGPSFLLDFILGTLILILNIVLYYNTGLHLNIYTNIILFFVLAILLSFIFNINQIQIYEYSVRPKIIMIIVSVFVVGVIIPGLFLGLYLESSFFVGILTAIKWGFRLFGYVILGIIYPVLRLISPLLQYFADIDLESPEKEVEGPESSNNPEDLRESVKPGKNPISGITQYIPYVLWGLLICVILWLIYKVIKKILQRRNKEKQVKGYTEERETIFTFEELKESLGDLWQDINIFKKRSSKKDYNRNDPAEIIREIYFNFLIKFNNTVSFKIFFTPNEYLKRLKNKFQDQKYYKELTKLYNKARYSKKIKEEDADRAKSIWEKIKNAHEKE
ncbi:MAG: hypothetical protein ACOCP5_01480 [Halanaerobiaceae bacterium]